MTYKITYTSYFNNQFKRLMKRYPKSEDEFKQIIQQLEDGIIVGTPYNNLGLPIDENVYMYCENTRDFSHGMNRLHMLLKYFE